ncbi:MAG TPA: site-specific integrase [Thermodesulfovibrionales bacterium]|nr:site-specific integrase [Thermodesulfovibrionales bacterium]
MSLYKRKDSNFWWINAVVDGRRQRIPTYTGNKRRAEAIHGKVLVDIQEGRWFENQSKNRMLEEMVIRFEAEFTDHKSYYQRKRDKTIFKHVRSYFGDGATLADVEKLVGGYEQHRRGHVTASTIVKELSLLRRMFNVARKQWKWKVSNPVSDIEMPKARNERVRYLSPEEYKALFEALDKAPEKWLKPCVTIAIDTGLRLSNVCGLMWSDVNLFSRMISISAEQMKNSDYIGIPLTDRVFDTLKELQKVKCLSGHVLHDDGAPLYYVKIQRAFRRALKSAGIENFRFHDLRHCFCSYLRQNGVDLHTIAILAGHRDLRMTKRYAHLNVDSLRDAVKVLRHVFVTAENSEAKASG